ncbi:MAG TPA: phosphotransferase [Terriglobia bacterium]|nr:phosphotransferase [Terriglobia bacterium]
MVDLNIEDFAAAAAYLREKGFAVGDGDLSLECLPGGVSNRTVLVRFSDGRSWVLKQALPKLRVAVDWFSSPERIHREALALQWFARLAPAGSVPCFEFEDEPNYLLGMDAVPFPHQNWKTVLLSGRVNLNYVQQFGRLLGLVHRRASQECEARKAFEDTSFFESLRLEPYYLYSAERVPAAAEFLHRLVDETRSGRLTLVHGDYSPKNILLRDDRLVLLDYEVAHFGEPAFDLGFSLTHFLSKAHHLTAQRALFAEAAVCYWQAYTQALGNVPWARDLEPRAVRHALGCLLARAAGRSPLEYLSDAERVRQCQAVLSLLPEPPCRVQDLVSEFLSGLEPCAYDSAPDRTRDSR